MSGGSASLFLHIQTTATRKNVSYIRAARRIACGGRQSPLSARQGSRRNGCRAVRALPPATRKDFLPSAVRSRPFRSEAKALGEQSPFQTDARVGVCRRKILRINDDIFIFIKILFNRPQISILTSTAVAAMAHGMRKTSSSSQQNHTPRLCNSCHYAVVLITLRAMRNQPGRRQEAMIDVSGRRRCMPQDES